MFLIRFLGALKHLRLVQMDCSNSLVAHTVSWLLRKTSRQLIRRARLFGSPLPWSEEPPWTQLLHDEAPGGLQRFHKIDVWHSFHMGIGKSWLASCVSLLQYVTRESSVDKRVAVLNDDFLDFCTEHKKVKYLKKLEPHTFNLKGTEPAGSWNKAHVTATLMEWMESYCQKNEAVCAAHEDLRFVVSCTGHVRFLEVVLHQLPVKSFTKVLTHLYTNKCP